LLDLFHQYQVILTVGVKIRRLADIVLTAHWAKSVVNSISFRSFRSVYAVSHFKYRGIL